MKKPVLFGSLLLLPLLALAADKLNVKVGLWEITAVSQTSGVPSLPKELLDRMTPDQRAQLEATIGSQASPRTDVRKECITKEDLDHPFDNSNAENCKSSIVRTTSTSQEVHMECGGEYKGSGVLKINTPTPETMNGDLDMRLGEGDNGMKVKVQLKGKWLSASCPAEAK